MEKEQKLSVSLLDKVLKEALSKSKNVTEVLVSVLEQPAVPETIPSQPIDKEVQVEENEQKPQVAVESFGISNKGGRNKNEDAFFSSNQGFCFAEIGGETDVHKQAAQLVSVLDGLTIKDANNNEIQLRVTIGDILNLRNELEDLINVGKISSLEIVCDGVGGETHGASASSIATYVVVSEIVSQIKKESEVNSQMLKKAIVLADQVLKAYNKKYTQTAQTTLVAALIDNKGEAFMALVGDSRIYRRWKNGLVNLETEDQSAFWELLLNSKSQPSEIFSHDLRKKITQTVGSAHEINMYQYETLLKEGEQLILCSDGVWEGIDKANQEVIDRFIKVDEKYIKNIDNSYEVIGEIRLAFGDIFSQINLKGLTTNTPIKEIAEHLTRKEVGRLSYDNVTAVVMEIKKISETAVKQIVPEVKKQEISEKEQKQIAFEQEKQKVIAILQAFFQEKNNNTPTHTKMAKNIAAMRAICLDILPYCPDIWPSESTFTVQEDENEIKIGSLDEKNKRVVARTALILQSLQNLQTKDSFKNDSVLKNLIDQYKSVSDELPLLTKKLWEEREKIARRFFDIEGFGKWQNQAFNRKVLGLYHQDGFVWIAQTNDSPQLYFSQNYNPDYDINIKDLQNRCNISDDELTNIQKIDWSDENKVKLQDFMRSVNVLSDEAVKQALFEDYVRSFPFTEGEIDTMVAIAKRAMIRKYYRDNDFPKQFESRIVEEIMLETFAF